MRRILRSFVEFLDTRFPEKVVITQATFTTLREDVAYLNGIQKGRDVAIQDLQAHCAKLEQTVKALEKEVIRVGSSVGFLTGGRSPVLER